MSNPITKNFVQENTILLNKYLKENLATDISNEQLRAAMQYSVLAGGKRLRPILLLAMVKTFGGSLNNDILRVARFFGVAPYLFFNSRRFTRYG